MLNAEEYRSPVLLFANGIGDHFLNLPTIRAFVQLFGGRLRVIGLESLIEPFLAGVEVPVTGIDMWFEKDGLRHFDHDELCKACEPCDLLISLNPWHNNGIVDLLDALGVASIGFFARFDHRLALDFDKHSADLAFDAIQLFDRDLSIEDYSAPPQVGSDARQIVRSIWSDLPGGTRVLAVHADTLDSKMVKPEVFRRVLDDFLELWPEFMVFVVGTRDLLLEGVRQSDRVVPCFGLPLPVSIGIVAAADLFLGVDSCMLHAADSFRVPGVGCFGSTDVHEFGFRWGPHRHVVGRNATMSTISSQDVLTALEDLAREHFDETPKAQDCAEALH